MTHVVLPDPPEEYNREWAASLLKKIQQALDDLGSAASSGRWIVNPVATADRTVDPTATAPVAWGGAHKDDLRQVVATLIEDLRARGILG